MGAGVRITSEIGRLRRVLCHTPGSELTVVTPANRADFLFDDLLDLEHSAREHGRFQAVVERFAEVCDVSDLLTEVLAQAPARQYALGHVEAGFREWAEDADPVELSKLFVEGRSERNACDGANCLAGLLNEAGWVLPPLPNLFFTRDSAAVVGDRVMIAAMKHEVRWTEQVIMRALFSFHPLLGNGGLLYDGTGQRRMNTSIEGGDVHVLRRDLLLLGLSERTSAAGIDAMTHRLFQSTEVTDVVVVILPAHRASIHLDMIFTMIDRELCCVFPPYFLGIRRLPVLHISSGKREVGETSDLFTTLAKLGLPLVPIPCGGARRTVQEREQWGSGCNMFAVAPGQLIAYDRNDHTLRALEEEGGFRIVEAVDFLTGDVVPVNKERFVITIAGSELVRGGGGPRCMTLPVLREDLP